MVTLTNFGFWQHSASIITKSPYVDVVNRLITNPVRYNYFYTVTGPLFRMVFIHTLVARIAAIMYVVIGKLDVVTPYVL